MAAGDINIAFTVAPDHFDGDRTANIALDSEGQLRDLLAQFVSSATGATALTITEE